MERQPRVSVIIPAYNAEKYIGQCLDSVLKQTEKNIEVICVNDGSEDQTEKIIRKYMRKDERVCLIGQERQFAGTARNAGFLKSRGYYTVFWDADDFFERNALKLMADKMDMDEADLCISGARQYDDTKKCYIEKTCYLNRKRLPEKIPYSIESAPKYIFNISTNVAWNKMFRKEFIVSNKLFFENIPRANDQYFVMMAMAEAKKITVVDKILMNYRIHTKDSLTSNFSLSPLCAYDALKRIHDELTAQGLLKGAAAQSFANKALNSLLYSLSIQTTPQGFRLLYEQLVNGGFEALGIADRGESFFYSKGEYKKYLELTKSGSTENYLFSQTKKLEIHAASKSIRGMIADRAAQSIGEFKKKIFGICRV